jgi:VCBS repeat-containing protein
MPMISQPILPANSTEGATLIFDGTTITYDPRTVPAYESLARNETLEDSFTYTLDDGEGGTDVATVSITVEGRNDAPTAVDDFRAVTENDTATVSTPGLLVNDNDVDVNGSVPDDDAWIIPQRGVVSPLDASVNINPDGSYRYDANSVAIDALIDGEVATETFPYIIIDNSRTSAADDTLRVLSGLADVDLPILLNDSVVGSSPIAIAGYSEDLSDPTVLIVESDNHSLRTGLLIMIEGYLGSGIYNGIYPITSIDRDHFSVVVPFADDPAATRGTWKPWFAITNVTALDNGGSVSIVDGQTVLYTALAGFSGEESFEYTIEDGVGGQDVATVVVEVVDPTQNRLLVASADRFRVGKGTADVAVNVLVNDVTLPGNVAALSILNAVATGGATGTVAITNGNTTLSYTPPSDTFVGEETFSYTISAGGAATSQAVVTFVVEDRMIDNTGDALLGQLSGNDDQFVVASESSGNVLNVLANDPNLPSYPVASTLLSVTAPSGSGTVNIVGDTLVYDAPTGIGSGLDTFDYTSFDGSGATTTQTVTVQIVAETPSFFAQADNYTVVAGSDMVLLPVLMNDRTVQDDSAVIRVVNLGLDGDAPPNVNRVAISGSQNFIEYTPPLAVPALGQEDFNYEIGIGGIERAEAKITITIVDSFPVQTQAEDDFFTAARDSGLHILDLVNNDLPYPLAGWTWTISSVGAASDGGNAVSRSFIINVGTW